MDRAGKKVRDISYHSGKNGGMVVVHSEAARAYSKYLEERPEVEKLELSRRYWAALGVSDWKIVIAGK